MTIGATSSEKTYDGDRRQLSDEVAAYVRELVVSGQLRPGEFIRLDRIASALSVSVTPVRQGLVRLCGEGLARLEPRRGFIVAEITAEDILDLFSVQAFVAGLLAAHAARNVDAEQLARLQDIVRRLESAVRQADLGYAELAAHAFHDIVIEAAQRPKLAWLLNLTGRYEPRRFYSGVEGWRQLLVSEHKTILRAIARRDEEAARAAMARHVEHLGQLVARNLGTQQCVSSRSSRLGQSRGTETGGRPATRRIR